MNGEAGSISKERMERKGLDVCDFGVWEEQANQAGVRDGLRRFEDTDWVKGVWDPGMEGNEQEVGRGRKPPHPLGRQELGAAQQGADTSRKGHHTGKGHGTEEAVRIT